MSADKRQCRNHAAVDLRALEALPALVRRAVSYEFGMNTPKRFGDMAAPADRPVRRHHLLQVFEGDLVPLKALSLLVDKRGRMIVPVDFAKGFFAIRARLACIPLIHDG